MSAQELAAVAAVLAAVGYLAWRQLRRRGHGTCCGARECPAAKELVQRMRRER